MGMDTYQCSLCGRFLSEEHYTFRTDGRARAVTARCKECRRKSANAAKYPVACATCGYHRRLDKNNSCSKCNVAAGLRQCRGACGQLLLALLNFYPKQGVCKECQKQKAPPSEG